MRHSPDCAMVMYADTDPATLKRPLDCDGVECEGSDLVASMPDSATEEGSDDEPSNVRSINAGPTATLTGDAARTFKAFQSAEVALRAAQKRRDDALRAFTEAVTR